MSNILISGSTGFVGGNLSGYLTTLGHTIYHLSRTVNDSENQVAWSNVNEVRNLKLDAYIHLAGKAHDLQNTSEPEEYFTVNTGLTIKLFDEFLNSQATTFIYFSSVKAAADTVTNVLDEDAEPNPKTPYGQSKLKAEQYLLAQTLPSNKKLYVLRPCMIHGPGNKGNLNLLYKFVSKGIPYPLAAFVNRRSFLFIDNLKFIINKLITDSLIPSGIYNMADDDSLSTVEVVKIISGTLNRKPKLLYLSQGLLKAISKIGDKLSLPINSERLKKLTENYVVSNQKLKAAMHVESLPVSTQDGLIETIKSFNYKSQR
jgi:nucleoside-diphosphate-sugar epimerase